jgi:multiple sugar transport system permease protein
MATITQDKPATITQNKPVGAPLRIGRILLYTFLILTSLVMFYPLLFALAGSISSQADYFRSTWFPFPQTIYLDNWINFLTARDLWQWVINTMIRVVWYIAIPAVVSILCGYVFTRLKFRGRDIIFMFLLSSMMVPGIVYVLPTFIGFARFPGVGGNDMFGQGGSGFINTWPALLLPGLVNAFYIFLMRQVYQGIPRDYEEAARVDGANTLQILVRIYFPLLRSALIVLVIFQFVAVWNDYLTPLVFAGGNKDIAPIALGAQRFIKGTPIQLGRPDYPRMFTVATIVTLPIMALFIVLQRYFVQGVQGFGLKG